MTRQSRGTTSCLQAEHHTNGNLGFVASLHQSLSCHETRSAVWRKDWEKGQDYQPTRVCLHAHFYECTAFSDDTNFPKALTTSIFMRLAASSSQDKSYETFSKGCCLPAVLENMQYPMKHPFLPTRVNGLPLQVLCDHTLPGLWTVP